MSAGPIRAGLIPALFTKHVDATEPTADPCNEAFDGVPVSDVACDAHRSGAGGFLNLRCDRLAGFLLAATHHDGGASTGEAFCHRAGRFLSSSRSRSPRGRQGRRGSCQPSSASNPISWPPSSQMARQTRGRGMDHAGLVPCPSLAAGSDMSNYNNVILFPQRRGCGEEWSNDEEQGGRSVGDPVKVQRRRDRA